VIDPLERIVAGAEPVFLLVAGPNGASKSTYTKLHLAPLGFPYVDPDALGVELFGRRATTAAEALQASVEAMRRVRASLGHSRSIALESVFSDSHGRKIELLAEAKRLGFKTVLIFIGLNSPELCIARVQDRVELGGHDVPDDVIRDRFPRCFQNLNAALKIVDLALLIDNSGIYDTDGISVDGRRHYLFGLLVDGRWERLARSLPRWFSEFAIGTWIPLPEAG
jgi:predicted ABC-type ATPase